MQTRQLGKTELVLTTVGLGTFALGGPWEVGWGPQDDGEAIGAILEALDLGINWIDTAPIYGCGHSEELLRQALRESPHNPLIATKCGILWDTHRCKIPCLKAQSVREECHHSLRRLGVEVIDLYQMHRPEPEEDIEQAWEAMVRLQEEGKVRYLGVSVFTVEQMERLQRIAPIDSIQPCYNLLHREIEDQILEYCHDHHIGVLAYSPLARGLLTGTFNVERLKQLPEDDHRHRLADFQDPQLSATLALVEQLKSLARTLGCHVAQLAIAWTLARPEVTSAIVGARRPGQIGETAPGGDIHLNEDIWTQIDDLLTRRQKQLTN